MAFFCQGPLKSIFRVLNIIESQKFPPGPFLKFFGATFGAIKFSGNKILIGSFTGSESNMSIFGNVGNCLGDLFYEMVYTMGLTVPDCLYNWTIPFAGTTLIHRTSKINWTVLLDRTTLVDETSRTKEILDKLSSSKNKLL